jgi:hypothetical protein
VAKMVATNRVISFFIAEGSLDSPFAQGLAHPFCFRQLELCQCYCIRQGGKLRFSEGRPMRKQPSEMTEGDDDFS